MTTPVTSCRDLRDAAIARSKQAGETDPMLKQWVFGLVHRAMVEVFGPDYSIRCMETAAATMTLLDRYGMGGHIALGALCIPQITANRNTWTWTGFWGRDHHFWVCTKLGECVDLALGQNHLHPVTRAFQPFAVPPVWWSMKKGFARVIMYMPYRLMGSVMSRDDQHHLDRLLRRVVELEEDALDEDLAISDITFGTIVTTTDDLNVLAANSDPWASMAHHFKAAPLPDWVVARMAELDRGRIFESELEHPDLPTFRKASP